jgi:Uma2 family endonuclease
MSSAVLIPAEQTGEGVRRLRFTRAEVERLEKLGGFEGKRFELIDGELIDKMGQNPPHTGALTRMLLALGFFGMQIRSQASIEISEDEQERSLPEPDISILVRWTPEYDRRLPRADELLLVIEVSDTSLTFDLGRKAVLYAKAGVREYWVLDIGRRRLVVHRHPRGADYLQILIFNEPDTVTLEGRPEPIRVADLLPQAV